MKATIEHLTGDRIKQQFTHETLVKMVNVLTRNQEVYYISLASEILNRFNNPPARSPSLPFEEDGKHSIENLSKKLSGHQFSFKNFKTKCNS